MRSGCKTQPNRSVEFEPGILGSEFGVLTHCACSNFGKQPEILPMHPINSFGNRIFGKEIIKNPLKI